MKLYNNEERAAAFGLILFVAGVVLGYYYYVAG